MQELEGRFVPLKQVKRREVIRAGTTVEQMVRAIADMIVTGQILPGDKLDEISLAARFEVSRTPVREALRELGAMGLVDREPNRSAVVSNVTETYLHSMFEAMAELEGVCARLAAERMTVDERRTLEIEHRGSPGRRNMIRIASYCVIPGVSTSSPPPTGKRPSGRGVWPDQRFGTAPQRRPHHRDR